MSTPTTASADPAPQQPSPHGHGHGHGPGGALRPALVLGAIGVVFGDIGTSPLYTLTECMSGSHGIAPDPVVVHGVLSLIFWSITLVVTVKYLGFLMRADNQGEGGILALLALVPSKLRSPGVGKIGIVAALVLAGAALLYGDGIITPAISVLSALEGLEVATASLKPIVVPATVVILLLLFFVQRRGTGGLGVLFGPVMVAWFLMIGGLGLRQVVHEPSIIAALSPLNALRFFAAHGWHGFRVLGGVVLAVTGGEALYADMGHFGRKPIQVGWLALIYPSLILAYLGQGVVLLHDPSKVSQPLYALLPPGPYIYPAVAIACAATVIASQALISGVFSLTHQAISLGYFPRLTVLHTSGEAEGQIYVPLMNWFLAAACIALVVIFRESKYLAAAYGLAVSGTMLITSIAYFVVTRHTFKWPAWQSLAVLVLFLAFDIPFVVANSLKFLDGGYLPFAVGAGFVVVMAVWRIGRGLLVETLKRQARPMDEFFAKLDGNVVGRVPGTAVLLSRDPEGVPAALSRMVERFHVVYERTLLVTVNIEHTPYAADGAPYQLEDLGRGFHRVVLRFGFLETPDLPRALTPALAQVAPSTRPSELLYVVARESFAATSANRMGAVSEGIFSFLSRNARNPADHFAIPPEQVVELGVRLDL